MCGGTSDSSKRFSVSQSHFLRWPHGENTAQTGQDTQVPSVCAVFSPWTSPNFCSTTVNFLCSWLVRVVSSFFCVSCPVSAVFSTWFYLVVRHKKSWLSEQTTPTLGGRRVNAATPITSHIHLGHTIHVAPFSTATSCSGNVQAGSCCRPPCSQQGDKQC